MGDRVNLQAGSCIPRRRFIAVRAYDLAVEGIIDALSLVLPRAQLLPWACGENGANLPKQRRE